MCQVDERTRHGTDGMVVNVHGVTVRVCTAEHRVQDVRCLEMGRLVDGGRAPLRSVARDGEDVVGVDMRQCLHQALGLRNLLASKLHTVRRTA